MNCLVTGGASGLGAAVVRRLAGAGEGRVYFTYSRSEEAARKLESELPGAEAVRCDFRSEAEVAALAGRIAGLELDVLVNNAYAGSFLRAHFHRIPAQDFLLEFKESVLPTVILTQAAIAAFRKRKRGRIVTILTSALVNAPPAGSSLYAANKAYLEQLVKVWAAENRAFNIASNAVSPSFMATPFTASLDERLVEQMRESHPLKRLLTPEEAAETVAYLCQASPHVNGANIVINAAMDML